MYTCWWRVELAMFLVLRFSSSRYFILGGTQCERTSMMEFNLAKLKACIVQNAILLLKDFITDKFWSMFWKLAVLKRIFWQKNLWVLEKLQFYRKGSSRYKNLLKNLLGRSFLSIKFRAYPCSFIEKNSSSGVFSHRFYKIALPKISEIFLWDFFAIPLLTTLQAFNL